MVIETSPALREALRAYSEIERHLVDIGRQADPARRLDMVRARRKLAEQAGIVGALIETDPVLAGYPGKQDEMRALFSAFRYAFGQHQATWPAVRTAADIAAYVASARETYGKADMFLSWCASNLDLRRRPAA